MTTTKQLLTHTYRIQDQNFDYVPDHIFNAIQTILNERGNMLSEKVKQKDGFNTPPQPLEY